MTTSKQYEDLKNASKANTPLYTVSGIFLGKVVDVYDGDTCRLAIFSIADDAPAYLRVRMLGYDAPEMKGALSKPYAEEVRDVLARLVDNKIVLAHISEKPDKYGRSLGVIYAARRGATIARTKTRCGRRVTETLVVSAGGVSSKGAKKMTVRGRGVSVPETANLPDVRAADLRLDDLLNVNEWMLAHARVKKYTGGARDEWSAAELKNGV